MVRRLLRSKDWSARGSASTGARSPRTASGWSGKEYTCPGCHRQIPPGLAHLVVWEEDHLFGEQAGINERRHWHTRCWTGRSYRYR